MSRTSTTVRALGRTVAVGAAALALGATVAPSPALAGSAPPAEGSAPANPGFFTRTSGNFVSASWLEVGELPPAAMAAGNAHFGDIWVEDIGRGRVSVFGSVADVQCEEGVTPYVPGGHGHGAHEEEEPPVDGPCVLEGYRFIEGGTVTLTLDKKLKSARLKGTLAVGSGHGEPTTAPPVDITFTGFGFTTRQTFRGKTVTEEGTYLYRYSSTGRQATITAGSRIGPMIFDDEEGEYSSGFLGQFKSSERFRP